MRASTQRHVQKHPKNGNHQYHASALRKSRKKNPQVAGLAIADGLETGTPDIPTVFMLCPAIEKTVLMFSNLLGIPSVAAALNWLMAIAVMTCHSSLRMIWLLPSQDFSSCSTKSFPENSIETEEPVHPPVTRIKNASAILIPKSFKLFIRGKKPALKEIRKKNTDRKSVV